jgi:hypothetical protein
MQASLDTPDIQLYLRLADAAKASAATLHKMFMQAPKGDKAADAIWDGFYALEEKHRNMTEYLRDAGGLLFLGSAAALAAAREAEELPA